MINLYLVYRKYAYTSDSVIGAFLVESHARQFMDECARLGKYAKLRMESTVICTYGMPEETRREIIAAVNPIVRRETAPKRIAREHESKPTAQ